MNRLFYFLILLMFFSCDKNATRNQAFIKGRDALKEKKYKTAETQLLIAIEEDAQFSEAWNNLGIAYYEQGETKKALIMYEKALSIDSCLTDAYQNKANALYRLGEINKAVFTLTDGLKCDNLNYSLLLNRATLNQQQNNYELALKDLNLCLKINGLDDVLLTNLGYCYYSLDKLDSAFHYSIQAIEINANRHEAINNLGMIALKNKKMNQAYKYFLKSVEQDPQNILYRLNLSKVAISLKNYDSACKNAKMADYYDEGNRQALNYILKSCVFTMEINDFFNFCYKLYQKGNVSVFNTPLLELKNNDQNGKYCELLKLIKEKNIKIDHDLLSKCK
ncbi:tetratricopeptide repeat protein [Flammeovirga kamogawensis]|uniref:Tetratricopeptide repeat protein n=1 Tax=Flammeovirga kamogawensis TaxID=373891 RepID=A0ABX8GY08_9BACT|nr:tetratricopeptide repeat protein [Flammeovirga kamogawensis]MBB6460632.1 Flp pilus assembly protein TadD [Flammeovirga kamogawensis]QWG07987.1 tetratricopeptide repeat protein [Flammeovirga kamogawensis]TRX69794.1 tetratricopeptide repeat protein [Flammeovirga kamogawensis]